MNDMRDSVKPFNKPAGCIIEEQADSEGMTLRWPMPAAGFLHYAFAGLYALFFCVWTFAMVMAARSIFLQPFGVFSCFTIMVLGVLTYAGACIACGVWIMLRPDRPESVRLELAWLRHDPGRSKVHALQQLLRYRMLPALQSVAIRRSDIRGLVLERVEERQRLSIDCGSERIEIGATLREPEREWLHAILQRWQSSNP